MSDTPPGPIDDGDFTKFTGDELQDLLLPEDDRALAPVPKAVGTPEQLDQAAFDKIIETLSHLGVKQHACEANGFKYETVRQAIVRRAEAGDDAWQIAWEAGMVRFRDRLAMEARRRAVDGNKKPIFHLGSPVGYVREQSDRLLELMLKGHLPETFGDKLKHSGSVDLNGGGLDIFSELTLPCKKAIRALMIEDMRQQAEARDAAKPTEQAEES